METSLIDLESLEFIFFQLCIWSQWVFTLIQKGCFKLIENDIKDIINITKDL